MVRQNVAVGEKENARTARGFAAQVPSRVEEFPCDLKRDEGLARACGEREQDALAVVRDGLHDALDGDVLIIPPGMRAALVFVGHISEAVAPRVGLREGHFPEFVRRGVCGDLAFLTRLHVDGVDAASVGGVGVADGELAGVIFGLADTLSQLLVLRLGLNHGELHVAIYQHIDGDIRLAAPTAPFDAASRDAVFAEDFATLDNAPTCRSERAVYQFGSGLSFVHWLSRVTLLSSVKSGSLM